MQLPTLPATGACALLALLPSTAWAAPGPLAVWLATAFFIGAVVVALALLLRDALFDDPRDGDEGRYDERSAPRAGAGPRRTA